MSRLLKDLDKLISVTQMLSDCLARRDRRVDEQINTLMHCKSMYLDAMSLLSDQDKETIQALVKRTISQIDQLLRGEGHIETAVNMLSLTTTTFERLLQYQDAFAQSPGHLI